MSMRNIHIKLHEAWRKSCCMVRYTHNWRACVFLFVIASAIMVSCERRPPLHLRKEVPTRLTIANLAINLNAYWDYKTIYGFDYDWEAEWVYGWDDEDRAQFGELGYATPSRFNFRRYYTGSTPFLPHHSVIANTIDGNEYTGYFEFGYWDVLVWNDIHTLDNVQSLNFDEVTSLDSVTAYTNPSMRSARYQAPRFTHAFFEPEALFSAYEQGIEINENLDGFVYDSLRNVWVKELYMELYPITYIYLTQLILHNNRGKITLADGEANVSGMARSTNVNIGRGGQDAVTVTYGVRFKPGCTMYHRDDNKHVISQEKVDVVGGRLMTFGICNLRANKVKHPSEIIDNVKHFMDMKVQFNNGVDTTFVFDVTDQVRRRFKGGVITVEVDMDTIPVPIRGGGSAFDAVVKDYEEETHEFDM